MRQVPDHQEVYMQRNGDDSIIVEVVEMTMDPASFKQGVQ